MRERLKASRSASNLKRGAGGLADVEFLVQMFQIKYGRDLPALRQPNTWQAKPSKGRTPSFPEVMNSSTIDPWDQTAR
jgi:GlnD PII-uridylyltransferase